MIKTTQDSALQDRSSAGDGQSTRIVQRALAVHKQATCDYGTKACTPTMNMYASQSQIGVDVLGDVKAKSSKSMATSQQPLQVVMVMRHGKRHDSDNPKWSYQAPYPWDTPLSKRGIAEIEKNGPKLEALQPEVVVVSPFLRCMQTAHRVISSWSKRPPGLRIVVDKLVSEVYQPNLLHLTDNPGCLAILKRWWWQRGWQDRARALLGTLEGCHLEFQRRSWPSYPEDKLNGRRRFSKAIDYWGEHASGNVLIITHGDAVLSGVTKIQKFLYIDNVHPGGWMAMSRVKGSPPGPWQLDQTTIPWEGIEMSYDEQHEPVPQMTNPVRVKA